MPLKMKSNTKLHLFNKEVVLLIGQNYSIIKQTNCAGIDAGAIGPVYSSFYSIRELKQLQA